MNSEAWNDIYLKLNIRKSVGRTDEFGNYIFEVEASNENLDLQNQIVLQNALLESKDEFLRSGVISYDHLHKRHDKDGNVISDPSMVIGEPIDVKTDGKSTIVVGKLYAHNDKAAALIKLLKDGSTRIKASVGGIFPEVVRNLKTGVEKITHVLWNDLALTVSPVNNTVGAAVFAKSLSSDEFVKALTAGYGTDFKATNGQSFTDEQIEFYINASVQDIARKLDITIVKQKIRCDAEERGLEKGCDYDVDEAVYDFTWSRIERYGFIKTRQRPILKLHKLSLLSRLASVRDITRDVIVDKTKGLLKFMRRPIKPTQTSFGIQTAINQYGSETIGFHLFYSIDYDAGFETSDDVPADLREIIAKHASVNLLNVIGDGLMSGFSSSSLSMDGLSESFSSTQSATSAYFGARIKEYKDDIEDYIKANRNKFGHIVMGCL